MSGAEEHRGELKIPNGWRIRLVRHDKNNLYTTTGHQVLPLMGKEAKGPSATASPEQNGVKLLGL